MTGLAYDASREMLYACSMPGQGKNKSLAWDDGDHTNPDAPRIESGGLVALDREGKLVRAAAAGIRPYDVAIGRNGQLYVSDWADESVLVFDPKLSAAWSLRSGSANIPTNWRCTLATIGYSSLVRRRTASR